MPLTLSVSVLRLGRSSSLASPSQVTSLRKLFPGVHFHRPRTDYSTVPTLPSSNLLAVSTQTSFLPFPTTRPLRLLQLTQASTSGSSSPAPLHKHESKSALAGIMVLKTWFTYRTGKKLLWMTIDEAQYEITWTKCLPVPISVISNKLSMIPFETKQEAIKQNKVLAFQGGGIVQRLCWFWGSRVLTLPLFFSTPCFQKLAKPIWPLNATHMRSSWYNPSHNIHLIPCQFFLPCQYPRMPVYLLNNSLNTEFLCVELHFLSILCN